MHIVLVIWLEFNRDVPHHAISGESTITTSTINTTTAEVKQMQATLRMGMYFCVPRSGYIFVFIPARSCNGPKEYNECNFDI
jgi:hypothetical protein